MQRLAGHGYGLILINPHGSNSYGQAFTASILGDYGNKDYEDLMKGLEVALERYSKADPDQVYVAGGSYGGFMTGWIVGHSHRFRRAVCQRMVSNWLSFYGTSDIGARFVEFQLRHDLTGAAELWRMSPVAYADQVKTPLLVLHGAEDHRCPLGQGQEMYNAVKRHYDQIELIIYPESSHGLSRNGRPSLRCARLRAISDWFAQGD